MSGTRAISTALRHELSSGFFFFLQGKAPKEIHAILTETLACFLPGRTKDLSVYMAVREKKFFAVTFSGIFYKTPPDGKISRKVIHSRPVTIIS